VSIPKSQVGYTLIFMVALSFICAIILSVLAAALAGPQEIAKDLDRSREMLISTGILNPSGYFQVQNEQNEYVLAKVKDGGRLEASSVQIIPTSDEVLSVYKARVASFLVNDKGEEKTFKEAGIDESKYLADFRKTGYYYQPWMLSYKFFLNPSEEDLKAKKKSPVEGYVFPVNGMGLWAAIYGYLAIKNDGNTVIGISWYDHKETPGLGADISDPAWQKQFPGKLIFQESADGKTDFETAALGITVVKGKVAEVIGTNPKAKSAVDGMAGATLTGNGVTDAYKTVLSPYRSFLIEVHDEYEKKQK